MAKHGVLGISFDHMHMGDLLAPGGRTSRRRDMQASSIRIARGWQAAVAAFAIPEERVFTDLDACLSQTRADLAIVCSATAEHANTVEAIAPHGLNVMVEKPFAANAADARRMIEAMASGGRHLAINWPAAWSPANNTAKRLIEDGAIGELIEIHFYGGNRGPLFHLADKVEVSPEEVEAQKSTSWWYSKASGGGSLLDYLGYGTTLGTWFMSGEAPFEVTSVVDETPGIEVDQHSITICRYARGLSKFETRWGTLTDPWTQQTQPKCGFVLVGSDGSISSYDYDDFVTLQTRKRPPPIQVPADALPAGRRGPIEYMLAPHRGRRADHRPARPVAQPHRTKDHRQRRAFGRKQARGGARAMKVPRTTKKPSGANGRTGDRSKTLPTKQDAGRGRAALGYAKPRTYEELRAVLSSGTIHFPKRLRQVAIFLWQHPGDVALGTIVQVAEQAGVQPSTLVRFAQIFGYAGFSDFQGLFKEHIKGSWPDGATGAAPSLPKATSIFIS